MFLSRRKEARRTLRRHEVRIFFMPYIADGTCNSMFHGLAYSSAGNALQAASDMGRAMLHRSLACCGLDAGEIGTTPYGAPYISNRRDICVSIAHSSEAVICAVARSVEVGVDVESKFSECDLHHASDAWLHPNEAAALAIMPDHQARESLLRFWTLKEALTKACGLGMALPFERIGFMLAPVRLTDAETVRIEGWQFAEFRVPPGPQFVAVAIRTPRRRRLRTEFRQLKAPLLLCPDRAG